MKQERRLTWMILAQNAELLEVRADTVTLGFANSGARDSFMAGSSGGVLAGALAAVTRTQWSINPILTGSVTEGGRLQAGAPAAPVAQEDAGAPVGVSDDDEDVDEVSAAALLTEALGAELISEEDLDV